jgi:hypothetical protein
MYDGDENSRNVFNNITVFLRVLCASVVQL